MEAIILKKIPVREFDELVVCYTKDFGKATYVAKSSLRPTSKQGSHLDILNHTFFSLVQKNGMPIITSAHNLNSFKELKKSLPGMALTSLILEVFDRFVFEQDPDEKLWEFLLNRVSYLNLASRKPIDIRLWQDIFIKTQKDVLGILGYDQSLNLEQVVQSRLLSLQFCRNVIK